jgi:hypothetical protein
MSDKRIRQITEAIFGREPFVYTVGQERNLPINGKPEKRTIFEIIATETCYEIYIGSGTKMQHWNDIAKSDRVNVQYFID